MKDNELKVLLITALKKRWYVPVTILAIVLIVIYAGYHLLKPYTPVVADYKFMSDNVWVKIEDNSTIKVVGNIKKICAKDSEAYYEVQYSDSAYGTSEAKSSATFTGDEYAKLLGNGETGLVYNDYHVKVISYYKGISKREAEKYGQVLVSEKDFSGFNGSEETVTQQDIDTYINDVIKEMNTKVNPDDILVTCEKEDDFLLYGSDVGEYVDRCLNTKDGLLFKKLVLYSNGEIRDLLKGYQTYAEYKKDSTVPMNSSSETIKIDSITYSLTTVKESE